jgi:hypothetical protein
MEQTKFRITLLRSNGSVWVEDYTSIEQVLENVTKFTEQYPHIVISKQKFFVKGETDE